MNSLIETLRGLPSQLRKDEIWRGVDFGDYLTDDMAVAAETGRRTMTTEAPSCRIPNLNADIELLVDGYYTGEPHTLDGGIEVSSLRQALAAHPELRTQYMQPCCPKDNPYLTLNEEHFVDGLFIRVPDGLHATRPLQIVALTSGNQPLLTQTRHLVSLGRGSELTLIQCDDSYNTARNFSNNVTLLYADAESRLQLYKLQNMTDSSALLNHTYALMQKAATLQAAYITLNGGYIRNHTEVRLVGEHCHAQVGGLYLVDHEQRADDYIFVAHQAPRCYSHELFKGIIDDSAQAHFNGHILVHEGAVKTEAYQSNRNILLTDKATVETKPFLEIYNDDVQCSHGSTIGQLDEQALFYIQSRGISPRTARTLLLAAFCDEVIQGVGLEPLRQWLSDITNQRLHGELSACSECALECSQPGGCLKTNLDDFHLDVTKL